MTETVLIVEDEPKLAEVLGDYLRQAGFAAEHLADGREVVPRVRQSTPELILLDLMLPGRDGMEICKEIRTFCAAPASAPPVTAWSSNPRPTGPSSTAVPST